MKGYISLCFLTLCSFISAEWLVSENKIFRGTKEVNLKGINWYGLENRNIILDGLFSNNMDFYLDLLKGNNFNAIQIPLSSEFILYNLDFYPNNDLISKSDDLKQKKSIEILDILFDRALARDIGIVLSVNNLKYDINSPLWYIENNYNYTLNTFVNTWKVILDRYSQKSNLIGINLYQSPNKQAVIGSDNLNNDWKLVSQSIVTELKNNYKNLDIIFFISGVSNGLDINGFDDQSQNNIVYAINNYAPSVYLDVSIDYKNRTSWDTLFGSKNLPIIISSWGGSAIIPSDYQWELNFESYLIGKNIKNNFFWSVITTPGIRSGLLFDDNTQPKVVILELLNNLQPNPTTFNFNNRNLRAHI